MFLNERAQQLIDDLRDPNGSGVNACKASICDAISIIMYMYQMHASDIEKEMLADAIDTLSSYSELLTALSKEK